MSTVILTYLKNIVFVSIGLSVSFFAAKYLSILYPNIITPKFRIIIFLVGTGMILVAAIDRLSWDIQTWDGSSPAEKLDSYLFWIFSIIGTLLLVFDYCIGFFNEK
jgi:hypothetical protein